MAPSDPVTEIAIFHHAGGTAFDTADSSASGQMFFELTEITKAQAGFIRQFWGSQYENPHLFVWAIEWETIAHATSFHTSSIIPTFNASLGRLFDVDSTPPITVYTQCSASSAAATPTTAALRSGITELAFYTMPSRPDESTKKAIEDGSQTVIREVQEIGKATGSAIGWVVDAEPKDLVEGLASVCLYGVFGYDSFEVHMAWRETPEGKGHGERSAKGESDFKPALMVPGVSQETGYFHVQFVEGK